MGVKCEYGYQQQNRITNLCNDPTMSTKQRDKCSFISNMLITFICHIICVYHYSQIFVSPGFYNLILCKIRTLYSDGTKIEDSMKSFTVNPSCFDGHHLVNMTSTPQTPEVGFYSLQGLNSASEVKQFFLGLLSSLLEPVLVTLLILIFFLP